MGDQIKKAFQSLKEYWDKQAPKRKKLVLAILGGTVAFALGLTLFLNMRGSNMVVLFPGMDTTESQEVYAALLDIGIPARLSSGGNVEVAQSDQENARGQLAIRNLPKNTLPYDIFNGSGGLTTTDFEKRQLLVQQLQNRLQDTIRTYQGVKNAYVTISVPEDNGFPWSGGSGQKSTASVSVVLQGGFTLSRDQVSGIKYLVASSVGKNMLPADVVVIDAATAINLPGREEGDASGVGASMERLGFEQEVEKRLVEKAMNVLTLAYKPEDIRVSATVVVDYNKMVTESKQYNPSDQSKNNSGVLESQDKSYVMGSGQLAEGVVGEEGNTDTPVYVDQNGDGTPDMIDFTMSQDFAVSYVLQQIEKDNAELVNATLAIAVKGEITDQTREAMIENVSKATNIITDNISVQNMMIPTPDDGNGGGGGGGTTTDMTLIYIIAGGVLLLLIALFILIMVLRAKKKKKLEQQVMDAEAAAREAEFAIQREIEEHKRQLKESAQGNQKDDAIANEVRDFARINPEITANLLRAWLKEADE